MYGIDIFQKLNDFLEAAFNEGLIKDGLVATDLTKARVVVILLYIIGVCFCKVNAVWGLRERLVEAQLKEGVVYKVCSLYSVYWFCLCPIS